MPTLRACLVPLALAACGEVHSTPNNPDALPPDGGAEVPSCVVPMSHPTIQAALDDASCGALAIMPGQYLENLTIARDVRLVGAARDTAIIDGAGKASVIAIASGTVSIEHVTIRNGRAVEGGGIANHGTLSLKDVRVDASTASARGGGVFSDGASLTLEVSTIAGNQVVPDAVLAAGGGIYVASGPLTISGGSIEGNDIKTMTPVPNLVASGAGIASDGSTVSITGANIVSNAINVEAPEDGVAQGAGISAPGAVVTLAMAKVDGNTLMIVTDLSKSGGGGLFAGSLAATASSISNNSLQAFTGGGSNAFLWGGGVRLLGTAGSRIVDSTLRDNKLVITASSEGGFVLGGGVFLEGASDLEIEGATISNNTVTGVGQEITAAGGALQWTPTAIANGGRVTITRAAIELNTVKSFYGNGAGVDADVRTAGHTLSIVESTIANNTIDGVEAARGGGVHVSSRNPNGINTVTVSNATVSGNLCKITVAAGAATGGAIEIQNSVQNGLDFDVASSTIVSNRAVGAPAGTGGLSLLTVRSNLGNTIVAANLGVSPDCSPGLNSRGFNLIGSTTGCTITGTGTDKIGAPINVANLDGNGGPTRTHALLAGSGALDAADPLGCSDTRGQLIHDQRGMPRIVNSRCDIGASER